MVGEPIACPRCRQPWPTELCNTGSFVACPVCRTATQVELFPAWIRPLTAGSAGEMILTEGEASCFFHPAKRAAIACHNCGRFLCGLCDVDLNGRHLCPVCLESGQRKGELTDFESRRVLYDSGALGLAILPVLIWPVTMVTAPMAIGVVFYGWNKPGGLVRRSRWRYVAALIISLAELVGWGVAVYFMIRS